MPEFKFMSEIDKRTGEILAVYFQIRRGKAVDVREIVDGTAYANYDSKGRLLGVELLGPCEVTALMQLTKKEPEKYKNRIKSFLKDSMPRKMALCS